MSKFVPESVLQKLVVGARVRYIPNYECQSPASKGSTAYRYGAVAHEDYLDAEHKTGTITSTSDTEFAEHPYLVGMDVRYRFGGSTWGVLSLAADELALVEDES